MTRQSGSRTPQYCHHRSRGLAYVRLGGRFRYLGRYGSPESKLAYSRIIAELAVAPPAAVSASPADADAYTVMQLCADYLGHAEGYYVKDGRPTDHMGTVRRAIRILRKLYGECRAIDFGPLALQAIQQHMVDVQKPDSMEKLEAVYSRKTINSTCGCIVRMFKWAVSRELLPVAIPQALATVPGLRNGRTTARDPAPVQPVDDAVVERTIPRLPPVVADMVQFQRLTGARPGEVCQIRPMDIERTTAVWCYRPESHKTEHHGRERVVFIGPRAQTILRPYLLRPSDATCFSPAESESKRHQEMRERRKSKVQPSQQNRRKLRPKCMPRTAYSRDAYRRAIAKAIRKANAKLAEAAAKANMEPALIPAWYPNQLRHTLGTEVRSKFGLEAAQTVLGHAQAKVTQIYAERDFARAADVMDKIG